MTDTSFNEVWTQLPFITRHFTAAACFTFLLIRVFPSSILYIYLWNRLPLTQPWTLVTSAFTMPVGDPMQYIMSICFLWMNLRALEENSRFKRSDLVFFVTFVQIASIIIGPLVGLRIFLGVHIAAITYYSSQESPNSRVMLFGIISVLHGLLPWINAGIGLLIGGLGGAMEPILGIFIGHLFLYLTELLPKAGGPSLNTPKLFINLFDKPVAPAPIQKEKPAAPTYSGGGTGFSSGSRFGGQGHKLGS